MTNASDQGRPGGGKARSMTARDEIRAAFDRIAVPNFFNRGRRELIEDHWQTWQEAWEAALAASQPCIGRSQRHEGLAGAERDDACLLLARKPDLGLTPNAELTGKSGTPGFSG